MAHSHKFKLEVISSSRNTGRGLTNLEFISWSAYPQPIIKKTELINRIGSSETIIQTLFSSSSPTPASAVLFKVDSDIDNMRELEKFMAKMVGVDCKLTDSINTAEYKPLVITDLATKIKKVGGGWLLIAEFNQFLRVEVNE